MIERQQLLQHLETLLNSQQFQDYCPNGLQVEGKTDIGKIVTGVTASQALIEAAIDTNADAILVHHGYFWKGENPCVNGMKKRRLQALLQHDINLFVYHLPLDAHPTLGNNAQLGQLLDFETDTGLQPGPNPVGLVGKLAAPMALSELGQHIEARLQRQPQLIKGGEHPIQTIAWCTGAAQSYIEQAVEAGADAFLTGEISEPTVHSAREMGIHFIAAGHHATERYGVKALGEQLQQQLGIEHLFIDIDNPV